MRVEIEATNKMIDKDITAIPILYKKATKDIIAENITVLLSVINVLAINTSYLYCEEYIE